MTGASGWSTYIAVLLVALVVPGPDMVAITGAALRSSRQAVLTATGVVAGLCVHAGLAVAGVGALLVSAPGFMTGARLGGGVILVWLGVAMIRGAEDDVDTEAVGSAGEIRALRTGFLVNVTNPKALLFFVAVIPQFVGSTSGAAGRLALLSLVAVVGSALWWALVIGGLRVAGLGGRVGTTATRAAGAALAIIGVILMLMATQ